MDTQHHFIDTNGVRLHTVITGPEDGEPIILLHGYPEFWYGWRRQIPALAEAGFRVIVPDQRGYNLSDKPADIAAYNIDTLADDVLGLADALGIDHFFLAGHDWGAAVSWWLANRDPERIRRMAILNVPHHLVMSRALRNNWRQRLRSYYMFVYQLPWLPEKLATVRSLRAYGGRDSFSDEDLARYREAWHQPGALTGMINWYRALFRTKPARIEAGPTIRVPVRMIWGTGDKALGVEMAQPSIDLCEKGELHYIDGASHFVQHDSAEQVNALLVDWFTAKN